jgi:mannose-6-phosphate isomerase-like protein (cupin superfamily)
MGETNKIEKQQAIQQLKQSGNEFISLFQSGKLSVEIYKPYLIDKQQPHERDEFYLIISGKGKFQLLDQTTTFKEGDFLFVPAYAEHGFIEFSDDFTTWVFFIG